MMEQTATDPAAAEATGAAEEAEMVAVVTVQVTAIV
jgi:hypothetical protein